MTATAPRTRFIHHPLEVCEDCTGWIAGDTVPATRPDLAADIERRWPKADGWSIVESDSHAAPGSSWSPCECCGSTLGGLRYDAIAFREEFPTHD